MLVIKILSNIKSFRQRPPLSSWTFNTGGLLHVILVQSWIPAYCDLETRIRVAFLDDISILFKANDRRDCPKCPRVCLSIIKQLTLLIPRADRENGLMVDISVLSVCTSLNLIRPRLEASQVRGNSG